MNTIRALSWEKWLCRPCFTWTLSMCTTKKKLYVVYFFFIKTSFNGEKVIKVNLFFRSSEKEIFVLENICNYFKSILITCYLPNLFYSVHIRSPKIWIQLEPYLERNISSRWSAHTCWNNAQKVFFWNFKHHKMVKGVTKMF